jgi:predicted MFS family arabinose efflux permease
MMPPRSAASRGALPPEGAFASWDGSATLTPGLAVQIFLAFALAYFLSALIRSVTATLAPTLSVEFALGAGDLGLLAGGYFLGFALTQLPLGKWLDRYGPRTMILWFLCVAVLGCLAFAAAPNFSSLLAARVLCGIGVSACLMAPLTAYRLWFAPESQLRANSWMLMTGSLGMVASTLPVQWLLPQVGWRPIFVGLALLVLLSMAVLAWRLPRTATNAPAPAASGYRDIWRHPYFQKHLFLGFFCYGGLMAIQTLWAGPWLVQVSGQSPAQAATGLFGINVCMLLTFLTWGWINPRLSARGIGAETLIARGLPISFAMLALIMAMGQGAAWWMWAAWCMGASFMSLAQPAVGMAFPREIAGRALTAYNLVIFSGVFVVQWGVGLLIDGFKALGWDTLAAFQGAFGVFLVCCVGAYLRFVLDNHDSNSKAVP